MNIIMKAAQGVVNYFYFRLNPPKKSKRQWDAAKTNRLTSSWSITPTNIDGVIKEGLTALRVRSQEQAQNNDYVRKFLKLVRNNVVGKDGLILKPNSLNIGTNTPDNLANDAIKEAYREWSKRGVCEVSGLFSWRALQGLVAESVARDGEVILRQLFGWKGNRFSYALQVMDVAALDVSYNDENLPNGHKIRMGIEFDRYRKPVRYFFLADTDRADMAYAPLTAKYVVVPAREIIHAFIPEWINQSRGIPWTATGLLRLNMLEGYEEAELVAARAASAKMGFYEQDPEGQGYQGDEEDAKGNLIQDAEPGAIEILPPGVKFNDWDPSHPNSAYKDFVKACLRGIASGLGTNYNSLANDLEGVNYNSLRQGNIDERNTWMALQEWYIDYIAEPVYEGWLYASLLSGAIKVNGTPLKSAKIDKYKRVSWQAKRWPWVDPAKEQAANESAWSMKTRSLSAIIREGGEDPDEVWAECATDIEKLENLGLTVEVGKSAPTNQPSQEDDETKQDAVDS